MAHSLPSAFEPLAHRELTELRRTKDYLFGCHVSVGAQNPHHCDGYSYMGSSRSDEQACADRTRTPMRDMPLTLGWCGAHNTSYRWPVSGAGVLGQSHGVPCKTQAALCQSGGAVSGPGCAVPRGALSSAGAPCQGRCVRPRRCRVRPRGSAVSGPGRRAKPKEHRVMPAVCCVSPKGRHTCQGQWAPFQADDTQCHAKPCQARLCQAQWVSSQAHVLG